MFPIHQKYNKPVDPKAFAAFMSYGIDYGDKTFDIPICSIFRFCITKKRNMLTLSILPFHKVVMLTSEANNINTFSVTGYLYFQISSR